MPSYQLLTSGKLKWYHFNQALTKSDQQFLRSQFAFSQESLSYCSAKKTPRPKITFTNAYTTFVFHIPYLQASLNKFAICELNVFLTASTLITVESRGNLQALNQYFNDLRLSKPKLESKFKKGTTLLFHSLITQILATLEKQIDSQGAQIDQLQKELFSKTVARKFVETVSQIRYNHILTHHSLNRQLHILESITNDNIPHPFHSPANKPLWNHLVEGFQTVYYELQSDREHLEGLVRTFESLVSYRTNEIIKLLTIFSVTLLPLNVITGIYGMNFTQIPFASHPVGFYLTVMWMVITAITLGIIFKLKRWV